MTQKQMITTNIRMDRNDWIAAKVMAAELNMSLNEFVNTVVSQKVSVAAAGGISDKKQKAIFKSNRANATIWNLPKHARPFKSMKQADASEDDKIIYDA